MAEQQPRPDVAFIAAALALLVMPVMVMVGLSALGLAAGFFTSTDRLMEGPVRWVVLSLFVLWVVLVIAAVLMLVSHVSRRVTRS